MATKKTTNTTDDTATTTDQADTSSTNDTAATTDVTNTTKDTIATTDSTTDAKVANSSKSIATTVQNDPLLIKAKNNGARRVFEPYSRTLIGAGEQVEIHCSSVNDVAQVKSNLAQLNTLGRRIVYS
ncbi:hypothetical protein [Acinetobacter rathckeae]|uniref:hypothetical protein n=1 Tax=Acinetobacter rathckeae TaxID=2605272 RepID=UPI0018A33971|nr:hypothetical protein [Acinetobacter rathckeae]MBF7696198.1 hypothetical protein [Acinetobacter rathckeae]